MYDKTIQKNWRTGNMGWFYVWSCDEQQRTLQTSAWDHSPKENQGQRADKFVRKYLSNAPLSFIYKIFRVKDVKVNGKRINKDYILKELENI